MNYTGKILVAHPKLNSSFFKHSVIYVCEDSPNGSQGIILNKSSSFPVSKVFQSNGFECDTSEVIYKGGPVHERAVSMLHTAEWYSSNTTPAGNYNVTSDDFMIEKMSTGNVPAAWRMVSGICGWAPGQLQAEVKGHSPYKENKGWLTLTPSDAIIFEYDGEEQWQRALQLSSNQMVDQFFN